MDREFHDNPLSEKRLKVYAIHRSRSRHLFFINFKNDDKDIVSKEFLLTTIEYEPGFVEYITRAKTIWKPTFDQLKLLLLIGTKIDEEVLLDERQILLRKDIDSFKFGSLTIENITFYIIVDNKNKEIIFIKK